MGKVLAGAGGFCGACGTAAAAAREAAGTGPCGSGEASAARAEVDGGVRGSESRVPRGCGSSMLGLRAEEPLLGSPPGDPCGCSEPASLSSPTHPDPSKAPWLHLLPIPKNSHVTSLLTPFLSASLVSRYPGPSWRSFLPLFLPCRSVLSSSLTRFSGCPIPPYLL